MSESDLERTMAFQIRAAGLPEPVREYRFAKEELGRQWRFDFAFPEQRVALEIDGGTWSGGRHTRGAGFEEDCRKLNAAAYLGWRVVRATSGMVHDGTALNSLESVLRIAALELILLEEKGE